MTHIKGITDRAGIVSIEMATHESEQILEVLQAIVDSDDKDAAMEYIKTQIKHVGMMLDMRKGVQ